MNRRLDDSAIIGRCKAFAQTTFHPHESRDVLAMRQQSRASAGSLPRQNGFSPSAERAIDVECDRFEAAWQSGRPKMEDHLGAWPHPTMPERQQLLWELVLIDLEMRWRIAAAMPAPVDARDNAPGDRARIHGLPLRPRLEDYFTRYPELKIMQRDRLELVIAEYRIRQQWGDRPRYEEYCRRFSCPGLVSSLRSVAMKLTPTVVTIDHQGRRVFSTKLQVPLEIGRQKKGEPPPYRLFATSGINRIVIAPLHKVMVSRTHLYLDVVAKDEFKLENRSKGSSVTVGSTGTLSPGDSCLVRRPLRLLVGQTSIGLDGP